MVRLLEQEGEQVGLLCIVDSVAPKENVEISFERFTVKSELSWIETYFSNEIISNFNSATELNALWFNIVDYLKSLGDDVNLIRNEIINNIGFNFESLEKMSMEELIRQLNFTRSLIEASDHYQPMDTIKVQIHYFAASESSHMIENWSKYTEEGMIVRVIQGDHFSIFKSQGVKNLYTEFETCLKKISKKELIGTESLV
jgi:thioesterase domain-containing protein